MSVTCSTIHGRGPGAAFLLTETVAGILKYTCECAGVSKYGTFIPNMDQRDGIKRMECVIHIWECPL